MSRTRLQTALDEGALVLPPGRGGVLRPPAGHDIGGGPVAGLAVVQGHYPDAMWWQAAGADLVPALPAVAWAVVVVPRSKALARALIAEADAQAGLVIVDGQRTDGVDALWREIRARRGDMPGVTKAHGRLFWFAGGSGAFADWAMPAPQVGPEGYATLPGVFSEGGVDAGSALLARHLPAKLPKRMADLGAGWGYLSRAILSREGVASVDLVEAEALALDCARLNVTDPRASFVWGDATAHQPERPYDGIVMNPPFHQGRAADPALGRAFIASAARMLGREGALWMVANRHLPYEAALQAAFRTIAVIGEDRGFKLFHASRPLR